FNCSSPGKHPRTPNGFKDATINEAQVSAWWTQNPDANIGVATGKISGISVLDIDKDKGGFQSIKDYDVPDTLYSQTGGGGQHKIFKYDEKVPTNAGTLAPGIDFRNDGGYILVPPSNHISGKQYVWCDEDSELAIAPAWMKTNCKYKPAALIPEIITEGNRESTLWSFGGSMRRRGVSENAIKAAMWEENKLRCSPMLTEDVVTRMAKSLSRYEPEATNVEEVKLPLVENKSRLLTLDDVPEGWLRDFCEFSYPMTEAPLQYHIATGLAIVATALGRKICMKEGSHPLYPNLYIVVVGASGGSRKSRATSLAMKFLNKLEPSLMLGTTMSTEAFLEAFQKSYCHLINYDEMKMLTDNEEKSYGKGLLTYLTSWWSCPDSHRIELKNTPDDKKLIDSPTPNLLCATTAEYMNLKEADVSGGFLGRFLPIYADGTDKRRLPRPAVIDEDKFESLLNRLKMIRAINDKTYTWESEETALMHDGFYNEWADNLEKEKDQGRISSYWNRIDAHVKKLAMIFDVCSENPTYTITKKNYIQANLFMETITEYFRQLLGVLTFSWADKKEKQIIDMLKRVYPKGIKRSDIMRNLHLKGKEMVDLMSTLLEKELVEVKDEQLTRKKTEVVYYRNQ
ncbi:MAG: bifunctional DNA primase/polymerase, partial [Candidatus Methanoperedens sp.]|nr:bifunctional DNA primase/polymerase [Candidatus Methanoperedens sp.]